MKLKIIDIASPPQRHLRRPFDVVLFTSATRKRGVKVAILFDEPHHCAVLDMPLLAAGDIAFGSSIPGAVTSTSLICAGH